MTADTRIGSENNRAIMIDRLVDQEGGIVLGMTLRTSTTKAIIDSGIAVCASKEDACNWRVTGGAGIGLGLMDTTRPV